MRRKPREVLSVEGGQLWRDYPDKGWWSAVLSDGFVLVSLFGCMAKAHCRLALHRRRARLIEKYGAASPRFSGMMGGDE